MIDYSFWYSESGSSVITTRRKIKMANKDKEKKDVKKKKKKKEVKGK